MEADGGLDWIMMGIGSDGHFCANLPGTHVLSDLGMRTLTFDIPEHGKLKFVTMGAQSVMATRHLLLIVNGKHKAAILKQALEGPVDENCPASVLKLHPNFTVIADSQAASELEL